jgi:8-oxo-dGTP diphosphatase
MDWHNWSPREYATLCFIQRDGELLLIHKKRGLGAGKINAPGGKIERGETALDSAIRETREEIGVVPIEPRQCGELHFQFADGYSLHCTVFCAHDFRGEPVETAEATPFWVTHDAVPYDAMWADDRHWLPLMLEGKSFTGFFTFDGETMTGKEVKVNN